MKLVPVTITPLHIERVFRARKMILLVLMVVFCLLDVCPQLWRMKILREQIRILRSSSPARTSVEKRARERQLQEELAQLSQQVQGLERGLTEVQTKSIVDKNIAFVTLEVENMAAASEVVVTSIKPLAEIPGDRHLVFPLEIGLKGAFPQLLAFLEKIAQSPAAVVAGEVSARRTQGLEDTLDVNVKLYLLFANTKEVKAVKREEGLSK